MAWVCVIALTGQTMRRAGRLAKRGWMELATRLAGLALWAFFAGGGLIALALLSIAAAAVLLTVYEGAAGLWLVMFSPVAVSLIFSTLTLIRNLIMGAELLARRGGSAMLSASRCPRCTYQLAGLRAAADGCVVCSECSSAWRATRIGAVSEPEAEVEIVR